MKSIYLIGKSRYYAQWVTEKVMMKFAREYYEKLLKINRPKGYVADESNQWDNWYLIPEPINVETSIKYLEKIGMLKDDMAPINRLTNDVWNMIVEDD